MEKFSAPVEAFYSYSDSPIDAPLIEQLELHLSTLQHEGLLSTWHKRQLVAGSVKQVELDRHLNTASLILLLVSSDFLASDYCYGTEMQRALQRHAAKEAQVIPILLRSCFWQNAPFATLEVLPTGAQPITMWSDRDAAWTDVVIRIRQALDRKPRAELFDNPPLFPVLPPKLTIPSLQATPASQKSLPRRKQRASIIVLMLLAIVLGTSIGIYNASTGNWPWLANAFHRQLTPIASSKTTVIPSKPPTTPSTTPTQTSGQNNAPQLAVLLNPPQNVLSSLPNFSTLFPEIIDCQANSSNPLRYLDATGMWHCFEGYGERPLLYENITYIHAGIYNAALVVTDPTHQNYHVYRLYPGSDFAVSQTQAVSLFIGSTGNAYPENCIPNGDSSFKINMPEETLCFGSYHGGIMGPGGFNTLTVSSGVYNVLIFDNSDKVCLALSSKTTAPFNYLSGEIFFA